jgi:hypothetical protein
VPRRGGNTRVTKEQKPAQIPKSPARKALEAKIVQSPSTWVRGAVVIDPLKLENKMVVKKEVVTSEELQRQLWKSTQSREIQRADAESAMSPVTRNTIGYDTKTSAITSPTHQHERAAGCRGVHDVALGSIGSPSTTPFKDKVAWWANVACQPSRDSIIPDLAETRTESSNYASAGVSPMRTLITNPSACLQPACQPKIAVSADKKEQKRPARRHQSSTTRSEAYPPSQIMMEVRTLGEVLSTVVDQADQFIKQYESEDASEHPRGISYSLDTRDRSRDYNRAFSAVTESSSSDMRDRR